MIIIELHNLLLQAEKCLFPLPVQKRHVDVKQSHQTIRSVFDSRSLSVGCPRHSLRDAAYRRVFAVENISIDAGLLGYEISILRSGAHQLPAVVKEDNRRWGDELLQCPSPGKPTTSSKCRVAF